MATIQGTLTDGDGDGIEDATITITESGSNTLEAETTTDASGDYSASVAADTYDVRATKLGYEPTEKTGITVTSGDTLTVELSTTRVAHKVRGQLTDRYGIGVLGRNEAASGRPVGVLGAVPNASDGYGLASTDDVRIEGTIDTAETDFVVEAGTTATSDATNVILGHASNTATSGIDGAVIGGGGFDDGSSPQPNKVTGDYGTVGGGFGNTASNGIVTVGGGFGNTASGTGGTVGGGRDNTASGPWATVGGGFGNTVSGIVAGGGRATVSGGIGNTADFATAATIGGGRGNTATSGADYATVGGGEDNTASAGNATVGGGENNTASAFDATVGGGEDNTASGGDATVGGGRRNTASQNWATVGGGENNTASGPWATVSGGSFNTATSGSEHSTISGGTSNVVKAVEATVCGGASNTVSGQDAAVGGGDDNIASGGWATVGGGDANTASGGAATIGGGFNNTATDLNSTVGGGRDNAARGENATVGGGSFNTASGTEATVPGGAFGKAVDNNSFVWNDRSKYHDFDGDGDFDGLSSDKDIAGSGVTGSYTFHVSAQGGIRFITGSNSVTYLSAGSTGWSTTSTRAAKTNVEPVDPHQVLAGVETLDVATWEYDAGDGESQGVRHIGPMAEDFHEAFDVGATDTGINSINADGVALAAIQGLAERLAEKEEDLEEKADRIADLETTVDRKDDRIDALEDRIAALEAQVGAASQPADD